MARAEGAAVEAADGVGDVVDAEAALKAAAAMAPAARTAAAPTPRRVFNVGVVGI
ncbi:hypothetical protein WMO79_00225 [Micrococcaceae bacterium Sec7.4]|uniref:hypothetical protein n=1 Tax=Arthrobacter sp. (strain FB24) TaxID=290399 RepID=UPI0012EA1FCC|nr:hypothetical protein [Arthrobacter sp. FB24]